jgi:RNA polymerase-binding transcription factor DksA
MAHVHAEQRTILEREQALLRRRIDELTVGGEVDMDYDDDFSDRGQVAGEIGENLILAGALGTQLELVDKALARIDEGSYGTCEVCDEPIGETRLEVLPMTSRCITHA